MEPLATELLHEVKQPKSKQEDTEGFVTFLLPSDFI